MEAVAARPSRVVAVTGAANGLGKHMVLCLLAHGFRVAAIDRDTAGLTTLQRIAAESTVANRLYTFPQDLKKLDAPSLVEQIERDLGVISILINNAGLGQTQIRADYHRNPPKFYEVSDAQWLDASAVNANAVFSLSRAVVHSMIRQGWGRIINITTSLGTMIRGGYCPYGPTKAAAEALSAVMAQDLLGTGVTVNVLIPGGVANTPMIPNVAPFDREALIQPEIMIAPLLWLLSEDADGVTGERFLANKWKLDAPVASVAAIEARAPIGWRDLAVLPVTPKFNT